MGHRTDPVYPQMGLLPDKREGMSVPGGLGSWVEPYPLNPYPLGLEPLCIWVKWTPPAPTKVCRQTCPDSALPFMGSAVLEFRGES